MAEETMVKTIADTILWVAKERQAKGEACQNLTSAIQAVSMEVSQVLMVHMDKACQDQREQSKRPSLPCLDCGRPHPQTEPCNGG